MAMGLKYLGHRNFVFDFTLHFRGTSSLESKYFCNQCYTFRLLAKSLLINVSRFTDWNFWKSSSGRFRNVQISTWNVSSHMSNMKEHQIAHTLFLGGGDLTILPDKFLIVQWGCRATWLDRHIALVDLQGNSPIHCLLALVNAMAGELTLWTVPKP